MVLNNWVILLVPEDEDYIVWLNSNWKHLFTSNSSDFIDKWVNSWSVTQSLSIDWKILFFSLTNQTFEIIDTDKFLNEINNLGWWFYSIWNDQYYWKISKEDYSWFTNITDVCKKLTLCENSWIDDLKINGKLFKKKLLKIN